jgi:hypothetical protein
MPSFRFFRQWGAIPEQYMVEVEKKIVRAVQMAQEDLAPAELSLGKARTESANFNRTTDTWKTGAEFSADSTDADRWLDTALHVMRFERGGGKRTLLWYHFSAHPVCYTDTLAGPDWPGVAARLVREKMKLEAAFLQGHIGDVNPGGGKPWLGIADDVGARVAAAVGRAVEAARPVTATEIRVCNEQIAMPLDIGRLQQWLAEYAGDPAKCAGGTWVDADFAKDWYESARRWDLGQTHLPTPLSAVQLGTVALLFHPAELYSCYGLMIRRDSPLPDTLVVGYTDAMIGYVADPAAYERGEYSALTVPKICGLPPFVPAAGRTFAAAAVDVLTKLVA